MKFRTSKRHIGSNQNQTEYLSIIPWEILMCSECLRRRKPFEIPNLTRTLGIKRIQFIFVRSLYSIWAVWVHFEFLFYYKLFNSSYTVHKITLNIKVKLINNYGRKNKSYEKNKSIHINMVLVINII